MLHDKGAGKQDPEKWMTQESVKLKHSFRFNEVHKNDKVSALLM